MVHPPPTDLTFLFTDIEGSTNLWEQHPVAMGRALTHHDTLMRTAIEQVDGSVFKTVGDAFCAVFSSASSALEAAIGAQHALQQADWGTIGSLRVRIAIHTGLAELRDGDYFGPTLNRLARLLALGHGGQILVSGAAQSHVAASLPPGVTLRDLGQHVLRNLIQPEQIYQVDIPGLPTEFPALVSATPTPHNLPAPMTSFIGRAESMSACVHALTTSRLLTLVGPGGTGKTRLSIQVGERLLSQFPDGVWLIELAPLSDPDLIVPTLASVVQVRESPDRPLQDALLASFQPQQALIILDNCEHLLEGCAALVTTLLRACPKVRVLASSREPLQVRGETTRAVPPLDLPTREQLHDLAAVRSTEAVRMLLDRVQAVQPQFVLTDQNVGAVVAICQRLDGIPLALELVAARFTALTVEQIVTRLADRFKLVTGGSRTGLPHQKTLRALIDWSYDLLTPEEQTVFRRLAVFVGGWDLEAAEQVVADAAVDASDVLDLLMALVQKSLVVMEAESGAARYHMLETIREYGAERLAAAGEIDLIMENHTQWCLHLAEEAEPQLQTSEQIRWLQRLEREHDNLRAALAWSLIHDPLVGLRMSGALKRFWLLHGHYREGRQWLQSTLNVGQCAPPTTRANAHAGLGLLAYAQAAYAVAMTQFEAALSLRRELGDVRGSAQMLNNLGLIALRRGAYEQAATFLDACLPIYREVGDRWNVANTLGNLGWLALQQIDFAQATRYSEESRVMRTQLGDTWGVCLMVNSLGLIAYYQGDYARAEDFLKHSLTLAREIDDESQQAYIFEAQALTALAQGDVTAARRVLGASVSIRQRLGATYELIVSLEIWAMLRRAEQQVADVPRLLGAAARMRETLGTPSSPVERLQIEAVTTSALEQLGQAAYDAAYQAGLSLPLDELVNDLLASVEDSPQ